MKRILLTAAFLAVAAGGGWAAAQTTPSVPKPQPAAGAVHDHGAAHGGAGGEMMCGKMMGGGMMGGGMMGGGMGPMGMMMGGAGTKIAVKNVDKGVTITLTSADTATVARMQKMAEAMRLMHEAMNP
jgi:hypothetical protein